MNDSERNLCLFRQMEAAAAVADIVEEADGIELDADSDIARAFDTPTEFACKVGCCAITGQHLMDYVFASGRAAPREEIDKVVAPSCAILDVPHDADRELARIQEEMLQPPDEV